VLFLDSKLISQLLDSVMCIASTYFFWIQPADIRTKIHNYGYKKITVLVEAWNFGTNSSNDVSRKEYAET